MEVNKIVPIIDPGYLGAVNVSLTLVAIYLVIKMSKKAIGTELTASIKWFLLSTVFFLIRLSFITFNELFDIFDPDTRLLISLVITFIATLTFIMALYKLKNFSQAYRSENIEKIIRYFKPK